LVARSESRAEESCAPRRVDPARIDRALSDLWRETGEGTFAADGTAVVRACGLTVIGLAADEEDLVRVASALSVATAAVPARTLVAQLDADVEDVLADVSATCALGGPAGRHVCRETIHLRVPRGRAASLPALIAPIPFTDLPVVVFAPRADLLDDALVLRILQGADLMVTDIALAADPAAAMRRLLEWRRLAAVPVRDLAFERLATWRETIAGAWDETAGRGAALERFEIAAAPSAEGLLLGAWIETRLGREGIVALRESAPAPPDAGGVAAVDVDAVARDGRQPTGRIRLAYRRYGPHVVRVDAEAGGDVCALPAPGPDVTYLLAHLLADPRADAVYEAALRRAAAG
jgi:hypothetical protein